VGGKAVAKLLKPPPPPPPVLTWTLFSGVPGGAMPGGFIPGGAM
jgi:hypothetical protein